MSRKEIKNQIRKTNELNIEARKALSELEILENKSSGYIIYDVDRQKEKLTQEKIKSSVSIQTAEKAINLSLPLGKYSITYDNTGRNVLFYDNIGNCSMFDTKTKNASFESTLNEAIHDVKFLHNELFHAVAQTKNVFIYDNQGKEVHCLRKMKFVTKLQFLEYHFLLVGSSYDNVIYYLDTSIGKLVAELECKEQITALKQNPDNAIIFTGSSTGSVSLWSPNEKTFIMKNLCHMSKIKTLEIDKKGDYFYTTGEDNKIRSWDLRNLLKPVNEIDTPFNFDHSSLSDSNKLALSNKNKVMILEDLNDNKKDFRDYVYLKEKLSGRIVTDLCFQPYEDILNLGHNYGLSTFIVPGSGDPKLDLHRNPFRTKKQRQNYEVKQLLEKIPHQMINMRSFVNLEDEVHEADTFSDEKQPEYSALNRFKRG